MTTAIFAAGAGWGRRVDDTELFFSLTDRKGVIRSANRVFERISGYTLDALVGRAHNVVRHPEMPRAVFRVLWERIGAGEPVAAYVCNRAADGSPYWVMATVSPLTDGHLSVRIPARSELFEAAKEIYAELTALERRVEDGDVRRRKPSIEASVARLGELLAERGFASYEGFMREALLGEVTGRAGRLPDDYRARLAELPGDPRLARIVSDCTRLRAFLDGLVVNLAGYAQAGRALAERSAYLTRLADDVRLYALNARLGAARLDDRGRALSAVAQLLSEHSQSSGPAMAELARAAAEAVADIEAMVFRVAVSTIQAEMLALFAHELDTAGHEREGDMAALAEALEAGLGRTGEALAAVADALRPVVPEVRRVRSDVELLGRLALNGSIEVARVPEATGAGELFAEIRREVEHTRAELADMAAVGAIARDLRAAARSADEHDASALRRAAAELAAAGRPAEPGPQAVPGSAAPGGGGIGVLETAGDVSVSSARR